MVLEREREQLKRRTGQDLQNMNQLTRGNCKWAARDRHAMQPIGDCCNLWYNPSTSKGYRVLPLEMSRERVISGKDNRREYISYSQDLRHFFDCNLGNFEGSHFRIGNR